jgi:hypothetical protein
MKFMTLSVIIVGILVLFNFGGITTPTTGLAVNLMMDLDAEGAEMQSPIQRFMNYEVDVLSSGVKVSIWMLLVGAVVLIGAASVRAGLIGSFPQISYFLSVFVIGIASLILTDMSSLFLEMWTISPNWMRMVYTSIFIPLVIMYLLSVKSYIEGTD